MGELRGFLTIHRSKEPKRDPHGRLADFKHVLQPLPVATAREQGARCMDCGVPFCHEGCPLGNLIPDWNDLVYRDRWREALDQLHATNNFPEFTGQICPAPCESACVLDINDDPVTIKDIELAIVNRGFEEGWIVPAPPSHRTAQSVAVVGSGPAGMAVAAELNKVGHTVTVFERDEALGGLNRFGVPDFKLEKWVIDRRIGLLEEEGVEFRTNVDVGTDITAKQMLSTYDAIVLTTGARVQRDTEVAGRELSGVHLAMDYLYERNRWVARQHAAAAHAPPGEGDITADGKHVIVIGGGDTGMDCLANTHRERPRSVTQFDTYSPVPESGRYPDSPWPMAPRRTRTTYALDEGGERRWSTSVSELIGEDGRVTHACIVEIDESRQPVPGTERTVPADLVLLAIGFTGPERTGLVEQLGLALDDRGNVLADAHDYATSVENVFVAGDARRGASLTVWAITEGRRCAKAVDRHLAGGYGQLARMHVDETAGSVGLEAGPPDDAVTPVG